MNKFLLLERSEQKTYYEQVGSLMGLYAPYVEKDFWVCWVLNILFSQPELTDSITFKGGTSLSKVWGVIQRFSEDIDLTINRDFLGYGGESSPEKAESNKKKQAGMKGLRKACQQYVTEELLGSLNDVFIKGLPENSDWKLRVDEDDKDGQTLLFEYPTCWDGLETSYVKPIVKLEFGARSDPWPASRREVKSFLAEAYPQIFEKPEISVLALAAERTFWEKVMLIHEESFRPESKLRAVRMARHYYDLWCLINHGVADKAMADDGLFESVIEHRQAFFNQNWVDYSTFKKGRLKLVPSPEHMDGWQKDYEAMKEMFLGEPPTFEVILASIGELESELNS